MTKGQSLRHSIFLVRYSAVQMQKKKCHIRIAVLLQFISLLSAFVS